MGKVAVVVPAAGQGIRFGGKLPKQFMSVLGKPLLYWTLRAIFEANIVSSCIIVLPRDNFEYYRGAVESFLWDIQFDKTLIVPGGSERQESVWEGIKRLDIDVEWVIVHDGARPMVSPQLFYRVLEKAKMTGAAIAAIAVRDTVKKAEKLYDGPVVSSTLDRSTLWLAQTPQIFKKELILKAYEDAMESGFVGTDDASLVERINHPVAIVEGDPLNVKITSKEDMEWLVWHLQKKIVK